MLDMDRRKGKKLRETRGCKKQQKKGGTGPKNHSKVTGRPCNAPKSSDEWGQSKSKNRGPRRVGDRGGGGGL